MNEAVNREAESAGRFGGALGEEFKRVEGMIRRTGIQRVPGMRVSHTSAGVLLEPIAGAGGGGNGEAVAVLHYTVASVQDDTVTASDGTVIAKPAALRGNIPPFTAPGDALTDWDVRPEYAVSDSVYAVQLANTDPTTGADFLDINVDGRSWHFKLKVCQEGVLHELWISSAGAV